MQIDFLSRHRGRVAAIAAIAAAAVLPLALLGAGTSASASSGRQQAFKPPAIKHVWVIELENEGSAQTFRDPSADPYLARTLVKEGALLKNYFAVGHNSLDNYIAQVTGQAPDQATDDDCGVWTRFTKGAKFEAPFHQLAGNGCVYPTSVLTIGNQLTSRRLTWKAYLQDMGNDPKRDSTVQTKQGPACGHPKVGSPDPTEGAEAADQFADRHEGFMYTEAVIANTAYCDAHVVSFQPLLTDLSKASTTPSFSWLSPNLCNDGHDAPCANGDPGGLISIDAFLSMWVPEIMHSAAYKNGLIFITFDEGSTSTACCGETSGKSPSHPNLALPGMDGPGGGRVGAVLLSPFIKPGTVSTVAYNHYSMLRSFEDIFGLSHLGDAAMPQVKPFGKDVYTRYSARTSTPGSSLTRPRGVASSRLRAERASMGHGLVPPGPAAPILPPSEGAGARRPGRWLGASPVNSGCAVSGVRGGVRVRGWPAGVVFPAASRPVPDDAGADDG